MKRFSISTARYLLLGGAFFLGGSGSYAQVTPGPGGSIVGQPPGQGSSERSGAIIGQPPPTGPGSRSQRGLGSGPAPLAPGQVGPIQPIAPAMSPPEARDPIKDRLNRTNREAADIDRDGRINPEEATRIPGSRGLPR